MLELCPCCGMRLLRHASKSGAFLRCGSCRFEIPEEPPSVSGEDSKSVGNLLDELAETVETTTPS